MKQHDSLNPEQQRALLADLLKNRPEKSRIMPASFAQQRLWFLDRLAPGNVHYNLPIVLRLKGTLDIEILQRCFDDLVKRHETLRTTFAAQQDEPVQVIHPPSAVSISVDDLTHLDSAELEQEARHRAEIEIRKPFDLATGPLFRVKLLQLADDEWSLLLTIHHIVTDGWSNGILTRELSALHQAYTLGEPVSLEALPIQYADFAVWQQEWLSGDELENQLAYWKQRLRDLPILQLPADKPRPVIQTFNGSLSVHAFPADLSEGLRKLSKRLGSSLFMTMLAGFSVLLQRYSGQDDIVVGSPIANRYRSQLKGIMGFFVNSLVMRTDTSGNPSFEDLLKRVQEKALEDYEHQDLPFEKLVEVLQPERDRSRNPLFQVIFALQNAPSAKIELSGLNLQAAEPLIQTARVDLEIYLSDRSESLILGIVYNTDLFEASTIERLSRHYQSLLEGIVDDSSRLISELPMLGKNERHLLLEQWNQTSQNYPQEVTVAQLVEAQVEQTPEAVAVEFGEQCLSYRELDERSNTLAHQLQEKGVGPGRMVGVHMQRSLEMVISLYGIWKAGGAYVPLDPDYPPDRIAYMVAETQLAVLLTQPELQSGLPKVNAAVLCVDNRELETNATHDHLQVGATVDDLAYVIYTSGSTGKPKGVMNCHRGIVNRLLWGQQTYALSPDDRVLQKTPFSFDVSIWEFFWPLITGARLVVAEPEGHKDPVYLSRLIRDKKISTVHFVPSMLKVFLEHSEAADLTGVKRVYCSGEALPYELQQQFFEACDAELHNLYGPTEAAIEVSYWECRRDDNRRVVPMGRPTANTQLYILDRQMQPVPIGVNGELYIGGVQVALGYLGQPELTAERFIADPFSDRPGARLYKTGDLVRYQPEGVIEYMGRTDNQVKLRGYRIELGEIETALTQQAAVGDAVVILREDEAGDKRLVAYVVPTPAWMKLHPGHGHDESEDEPSHHELISALKQHLRAQLPVYMLPSVFMVLDEFPLNSNGKLDRRALPDLDEARSGMEVGYVAASTELEQQIAQIWAEVLKLERVGIHDNFFDLGGHSLLATRVVSRIRSQLNVELPLAEIFDFPTVAELAFVVTALIDGSDGDVISSIMAVDRKTDVPLSFAQERLWFLDQLQPGNPAYILPLALRLKGKLLIDALFASLNYIVDRHEALRTRFVNSASGPVQIIENEVRFELTQTDLSAFAVEDLEAEISACLKAEKTRPFDLATDLPIRGSLLKLSNEEHVLLLTMHHIGSDGWSVGVLLGELGECYSALSDGAQPQLAELPIQYADFAAWQRQWLSGEQLDRQQDYWSKQLEDLQVLELPTDRTRPAIQTYDGARELLLLDKELGAQLEQLSKDNGVTLFMTLLTVYMAMLHRYSGQDDIVIGTPIANRNRSELEGLIAFFVNTLVMRVDCSGNPDFNSLVQRVSEMALGAFAHQDIPFEKLVDLVQVDRDPSRNPLFQVQFALQNAPFEAFELRGLSLTPVTAETQTTRFDLECHVWSNTEELQIGFVYNTNLFDESTIRQMLRHYANLLAAVVAEPGKPLDLLPMLDRDERHLLLEQWNQARTDYTRAQTVSALFEQQAAATPDAIAIEYEGKNLSYAELNARANQLAFYLQARGVGPEVMVGLCMERSLELPLVILGILKAGGAYVPLDPDYPQSRLEFILEDCAAPILLTQTELQSGLPDYTGQVIYLDTEWSNIAGLDDRDLPSTGGSEQAAYVIYTSGSTGQPKGVVVTHGNVTRLFAATEQWYGFNEQDVWTLFHSSAFDFSVWEIWGALLHGGRLVVVPFAVSRSPELFHELLTKSEVTVLNQTPSAFKQLMKADESRDPGSLGALRLVIFGGEALDPQALRPWFEKHGDQQPQLVNMYGITETTVHVSYRALTSSVVEGGASVIGQAIPDLQIYILDRHLQPVPVGVPGEMYVGGAGLARGYLNRPELTAERFIAHPFSDQSGARLYKTGDLARYLADGDIEYLGRSDHQVKLRGFRIELGEIENLLCRHDAVREAVVLCRDDAAQGRRLVAYVIADGLDVPAAEELRGHVREELPEYMVPAVFMTLDSFPLTANGKLDQRALPMPDGERQTGAAFVAPRSDLERQMVGIWQEVLGVPKVGIRDNFFDLGGHSLLLSQIQARLKEDFDREIPMLDLFQYPTIDSLTAHLVGEGKQFTGYVNALTRMGKRHDKTGDDEGIAIVSMAGRFPGAASVEQFWDNLATGVESIRFFSDEELMAAGVSDKLVTDLRFVPAKGFLDDAALFDAAFFGYAPHEAELIDPQQRLFLECAWEALERAGYDPERYRGLIGVYAGSTANAYRQNLNSHPELVANLGMQVFISSDKDFLPVRTSYKLNLRGPSVTVQTACSTSLVAIHEACKSLREYECDIALAGGATVLAPRIQGHMYQEESILSADGHCRAFSADANGTVCGEGVGIVALKRLSEALLDGDVIHAVIRGSAINNDGSNKVGFTAPSVAGQAEVIAMACAAARVSPASISYIETHGTGTRLGDPIEVAALARVFEETDQDSRNKCALGALKASIGHLDAAAGVSGVIKTALALEHRQIPPSLNFSEPNPEIDFNSGPFYVNTELRSWDTEADSPRRAGVSSFGIGGTNAHAILEQAPAQEKSGPGREWQLIPVSAKNEVAMDMYTDRIAEYLEQNPDTNLADLSFTLRVGRGQFDFRRAVICNDNESAIAGLRGAAAGQSWTKGDVDNSPPVIFMFPGQGSQYIQMGQGLYESETLFRDIVDDCCEQLKRHIGIDLRETLFSRPAGDAARDEEQLRQPLLAQCSLFVIEYALAKVWMSWGIQPAAMIGHSIGEYVAACIAGVIELDEALLLIASRGQAMEQAPVGAMLSVLLPEQQLIPYLEDKLWLSVINGHSICVISGTPEAIDDLEQRLVADDIEVSRLNTSGAFHSGLMDEVVPQLVKAAGNLNFSPPQIPYISNVTGSWVDESQLQDPEYWGQHLRKTVRFAAGVDVLLEKFETGVFLEVGPGKTLSSMLRQAASDKGTDVEIISSLKHPRENLQDGESITRALAELWLCGIEVDWQPYDQPARRCRVELPTYPFQRQEYWVEFFSDHVASTSITREPMKDWFYMPAWKSSMPKKQNSADGAEGPWLILCDNAGVSGKIKDWLLSAGHEVVCVLAGDSFAQQEDGNYTIEPGNDNDYRLLFENLRQNSRLPRQVIHTWAVTAVGNGKQYPNFIGDPLVMCYHSLIYLTQALVSGGNADAIGISVVSNNAHRVLTGDSLYPEKATLLGPCGVIGLEHPNISCRNIEIEISDQASDIAALMTEILNPGDDKVVVYRNGQRWVKIYEPVTFDAVSREELPLKPGGVYLITGGLGGIGLAIANFLAQEYKARLVLTSRSGLPPGESWSEWLAKENGNANSMAERIKAVHALQEHGSEVLVLQADVVDKDGMREVLDLARERFGEINGVIHSAGLPGGRVMQLQSAEIAEAVMAPKVEGTRVIGELCCSTPLDFIVLCSSLASVLGGYAGQVDYCSANAFQDAYANYYSARYGIPVFAINWDSWNESGMAVNALREQGGAISDLLETGLKNSEGIEAFKRILALATVAQIAVSTYDLSLRAPRPVIDIDSEMDAGFKSASSGAASSVTTRKYERPDLSSTYVEPRTQSQMLLSDIWKRLFKLNEIGIHDNFFELGGDSLLAIQSLAALRKEFNTGLSIDTYLELGTIEKIASHIDALEWVKSDTEEIFASDGPRKEFEL